MNRTKSLLAAATKRDLYLAPALLLGYFLFLLPDITLPGLNASEAEVPLATAAILRIENTGGVLAEKPYREHSLPIMKSQYGSYIDAYMLVPFVLLFGLNVFAIRIASVAVSLATLVYVFLLLRAWFGRWTAYAALALIISNPVFVINHKLAWDVNEVYLACFFWGGLYHLYRYYSGGKRRDLVAAAFFLGLGLNKISFFWYIAGSLAAAAVLRKSLAAKRWMKPGDLLCAIPAVCAGGFLMIYYNLRTHFHTVAFMFSNLMRPTIAGVDNHAFFANLGTRFEQLVTVMINGRDIGQGVQGDWAASPNAVIFAIAMLFLFLMCLTKRIGLRERKRTAFLAVIFVVAFLCSPLTVSRLTSVHLYGLFFLAQMLAAVALCSLPEVIPFKKAAACLTGILMAVMLASNIAGAAHDVRDLRKTGGSCTHATAIYGLASWLDENKVKEPVVVSSIGASILFLTRGRVANVIERQSFDHQDFMMTLKGILSRGTDIYFVTASKETGQDYYVKELEEFLAMAMRRQRNPRMVRTFNDLAGQPEYVLHKLARRK